MGKKHTSPGNEFIIVSLLVPLARLSVCYECQAVSTQDNVPALAHALDCAIARAALKSEKPVITIKSL